MRSGRVRRVRRQLSAAFWGKHEPDRAEVIVILLIWITVAIGIMPMSFSKWINGASAVVKVLVLVMLGGMGLGFMIQHGSANSFALALDAVVRGQLELPAHHRLQLHGL